MEVRPVSQVNNRVFAGPGRYMPEYLPALQLLRNHHRIAGAQPVQRFRTSNQIATLRPLQHRALRLPRTGAGRGVLGRGRDSLQVAVVEVGGAFPLSSHLRKL